MASPQISQLRNVEIETHRLPSFNDSSMAAREKEAEKLNERAAVANPQEVVSMVETWVPLSNFLHSHYYTNFIASCNNYTMQLNVVKFKY
ncbi:hypothetical protein TSUD_18910 [Trifolium subterraneum]|uniref:Uncharacterized protein n=1 Tax=Trifolium subterraneum TaxID=3900 RepID=A0A2Z6MFB8_TRISU|nr:hypothetical protein TSUD_18910 [Trifolium subterraneum]